MPMKTRFFKAAGRFRNVRARRENLPQNSPMVMLRRKPIFPVAQKVQPRAQPTWVDRHRV